jgi:hypothetical protein
MSFMLCVANKPCMLSVVMLNVVMPNVVMPNVFMMSAVIPNVVMLSVMAPVNGPMWLPYDNFRTILNSLQVPVAGLNPLVLGLWVNYYTTVLQLPKDRILFKAVIYKCFCNKLECLSLTSLSGLV